MAQTGQQPNTQVIGRTIAEYSITDHGIEHAQYFQGDGVAFSKYDYCTTGAGNNLADAIDDALESMAQSEECDGISFDLFERRIKAQEYDGARDWPASDEVPDDADECYYYVTIKYNVTECRAFEASPIDSRGNFAGELPDECVTDCTHAGQCDADVEHWRQRLNFTVPRELAIEWLAEFGAWPVETDKYDRGLNNESDETLAARVLWLACGDVKENGQWYGMVS